MAKTAVIQARIEPSVKKKAQKILETLNISMSEAISIYLTQVTLQKGIPFEIRIPNKVTMASFHDVENRTNLHSSNSANDLFEDLNK
jgi:DNA-damage-inducible protein J